MEPNPELTKRLKDTVDKLVKEEMRMSEEEMKIHVPRFYEVPVTTFEQVLYSGKTYYWMHNSYLFTSIPFEDVIKCLKFDNPPDLGLLKRTDYANRYMFLSPNENGFKSVGVDLTENDKQRLGLEAHIQINDLAGIEHFYAEIIQEAYKTSDLITNMCQPEGIMKIPGNFFNIIYEESKRTNSSFFIVNATSNEKDPVNDEKKFCIAHL